MIWHLVRKCLLYGEVSKSGPFPLAIAYNRSIHGDPSTWLSTLGPLIPGKCHILRIGRGSGAFLCHEGNLIMILQVQNLRAVLRRCFRVSTSCVLYGLNWDLLGVFSPVTKTHA